MSRHRLSHHCHITNIEMLYVPVVAAGPGGGTSGVGVNSLHCLLATRSCRACLRKGIGGLFLLFFLSSVTLRLFSTPFCTFSPTFFASPTTLGYLLKLLSRSLFFLNPDRGFCSSLSSSASVSSCSTSHIRLDSFQRSASSSIFSCLFQYPAEVFGNNSGSANRTGFVQFSYKTGRLTEDFFFGIFRRSSHVVKIEGLAYSRS